MQINLAAPAPALGDPDDFRSFAAVMSGSPDARRLASAVGDLGRADGDTHVYVSPEAVLALTGARPEDPEWRAQFDAMVEFARSKGWTNDAGQIRAHVEWLG